MKKLFVILFSTVFVTCSFSQINAIKISNPNSQKEIIIEENSNIRIKTLEGKKLSGKFHFLDNNSIVIKNKTIPISTIEKIKRNPLLLHLANASIFLYTGLISNLFIFYFNEAIASEILLLAGITPPIIGIIASPNILKGYKRSDNWCYELVQLSHKQSPRYHYFDDSLKKNNH